MSCVTSHEVTDVGVTEQKKGMCYLGNVFPFIISQQHDMLRALHQRYIIFGSVFLLIRSQRLGRRGEPMLITHAMHGRGNLDATCLVHAKTIAFNAIFFVQPKP